MTQPWTHKSVIHHSQRLLQSFCDCLGRPLLPQQLRLSAQAENPILQAQELFEAPFVVVSHGTEADPIFNYGNALALDLWELSWEAFTQLPSRKSARRAERPERAEMLALAKQQGFINRYVGERSTSSGKAFRIEDGTIWTVADATGTVWGQAATFSQYHFL